MHLAVFIVLAVSATYRLSRSYLTEQFSLFAAGMVGILSVGLYHEIDGQTMDRISALVTAHSLSALLSSPLFSAADAIKSAAAVAIASIRSSIDTTISDSQE